MTFGEAGKQMRQGYAVRRRAWIGKFLYRVPERVFRFAGTEIVHPATICLGQEGRPDLVKALMAPTVEVSLEEFEADDWENYG